MMFMSLAQVKNMSPQQGDKIMMFKDKWVKLLLNKTKKMEVRSKPFEEGIYWIGCKQMLLGSFRLGKGQHIKTIEKWTSLRSKHCCETNGLPYKKTWCFEVSEVEAITPPIAFKHPRGAISIVRYRE